MTCLQDPNLQWAILNAVRLYYNQSLLCQEDITKLTQTAGPLLLDEDGVQVKFSLILSDIEL